jgi:D-lactate dehydrogenase
MKVTVFGTREYDRASLEAANAGGLHALDFVTEGLTARTAARARGAGAVCTFVNDQLDATVLEAVYAGGARLVALRSTGYDNVDLDAAGKLGLTVLRVPAYSPHAVAEHAIALILALNRKTHLAHARVHRQDFTLEGFVGFDLFGKTAGVVGTGRIGIVAARILGQGFGCTVLASDPVPCATCTKMGVRYVELAELLVASDIVTLHCPLTTSTRHLIDGAALNHMKPGAMLVNTSRGAVLDTQAAIAALSSGKLGALGLDVYEGEAALFFRDLSDQVITDEKFGQLLTFPNVIVTGHQAFLTNEALRGIAETTIRNITDFERGNPCTDTRVPQQKSR